MEQSNASNAEKEYYKSEYGGIFWEFDELTVQYGFCFLFSTAFPAAPALAIVNNLVEYFIDSKKLVKNNRRPIPRGSSSIGSWEYIINIQSYAAVLINTFMICTYIVELKQNRTLLKQPGSPQEFKDLLSEQKDEFLIFIGGSLLRHAMLCKLYDTRPSLPLF